jgi:predicted glutamine amidotransferase
MCIIVSKDKNTKLPKDEYLKNCFTYNPDGAGFMYTKHNKVVIDKGYMTYESFINHYQALCKKYNNFKNKSLIMHFRIGTAGANSKENTHPYPITYDKNILHKTYYETDLGMAHNGIISQYNPQKDDKTTNDTQNFIMNYVYPLYKNYHKFYKNPYIMDGLEDITSSKLAFLDKYDNIYLVGDFETDEDGVKYSNSNYLPYVSKYNYYGYYDKYYDDYYKKYYDKYYTKEDNKYEYADEEFLDTLHEKTQEPAYENEILLDSKWYISIDEKPLEKVGDKDYVYDYYYGLLYEVNDLTNDYEYISNNVEIFDENGEELLF